LAQSERSAIGSAFRVAVPAEGDSFKVRSGKPKVYVKTTAESGAHRDQAFCSDCGSPIYASAAGGTPPLSIRVGTIRQRDQLIPRKQVWFRSAQRWLSDLGNVTKHEKS